MRRLGLAEPASLRARLLARLLVPMVILLAVSAAVAYFAAFRFANQVYDRTISDTSIALSQLTHRGPDGALALDLPREAQHMLASDQRDSVYYAVIHAVGGGFLAGHHGLPEPASVPEPGAPPQCSDATYRGDPVRIAAYRPADTPVVVLVAETVVKRDLLAFEIIASMLLPLLALVALGTAAIWMGVAQGLRPLVRMAEQLRDRSAQDLGPVDESSAPSEVRPVVQALNGLLAQVDTMLTSQQRFVADAAHQLRTPIAGLKTQAETALRAGSVTEIRPIVANIVAAATRMSSLVTQLLALARFGPEARPPLTPLDLEALAREVTADWITRGLELGMDLGYEGDGQPHWVRGDPVMLRELLGNLVDNTLRHCPSGTEVTVAVRREGERVLLQVTDTGPGIPETERRRVFERFYRLADSTVPGTGLGLSIAEEIARSHGARLDLGAGPDGHGTLASVSFPGLADGPHGGASG